MSVNSDLYAYSASWMDRSAAVRPVEVLILPLPLFGAWQFRRLKARIAAGERTARIRQYRGVMVEEVVLVGAVLAIWLTHDRPSSMLSAAAPLPVIWVRIGWGAAVIVVALLILQAVLVVRSKENFAAARMQLEKLAAFLP